MTGKERRGEIVRQLSYVLKQRRQDLERMGIQRCELSGVFARAIDTTRKYASTIITKYEQGLLPYATTARYITNTGEKKDRRRPVREHYRRKYLRDIGIYLRILEIKPP